jgi:hypothetical protein
LGYAVGYNQRRIIHGTIQMHGTIQVPALVGATGMAMISPDASIEDILQYFTVGADLSKR